jgi:glycosyltransferase involved in cell wall biosynthesis
LTSHPRVCIVTPSYNQGRFIARTVNSVLDQQYPNLQYVVQDGASTDETIEVLYRYPSGQLTVVSESDSGQSQAINRGFARTSGEIMAWLNSDDILLPNSVNAVVSYFTRHPEVDVIYGNRLLIDEQDRVIGRWVLPGHDAEVLSWADWIPQETLFWRRRIWDRVGAAVDESFRFAMDWDLLLRFRDYGARFHHMRRYLGAFRVHDHQKTSASLNDVGCAEMDRLRGRVLGRIPSAIEINKNIAPFMRRHVFYDRFLSWQ